MGLRRLAVFALGIASLVACDAGGGGLGRDLSDGSTYDGEPDWCRDDADLSDLRSRHTRARIRETYEGIATRRYPPALAFIDAQTDELLRAWATDPDDFGSVLRSFATMVHEGSHHWTRAALTPSTYPLRVLDDDLVIEMQRFPTFPRGEILTRHPNPDDDVYADLYLVELGYEDLDYLLDEYNAYTTELPAMYCTRESLGNTQVTSRVGTLTFLFYVQTYLAIAREEHPDVYRAIVDDPGHVDAILSIFDRAEHWLGITEGIESMSLYDDEMDRLVHEPKNLDEIDRLR